MEQKLAAHAETKVRLSTLEQEKEGWQQEKAELSTRMRRAEDKLRKVTAERDQVEADLATASGQVRGCPCLATPR